MADTIVDDRAVFTCFDSLTYAPRGIEITLPNSSEKHYIPDVLEELKPKKKEHLPDFSCEYFTDEENCLVGLFWSDGESKRNYQVFGDIMSFDATYRSNRYSMVFVPFIGIDNHNNNVSFGAALLASETAETYKWLLRCFLKAFGKQPDVVVTDQDPAMKKAIEEVFSGSRHRLCMWHVMHKLSTKVGVTLCNTTDFKQRICDIVWTDSLSPSEFELGWHSVIQDFDLSDNNWLGDIYDMRESWIPAYYRDELMSGLMRTTSRSESENHFFGQVCNVRSTLLEFLTHFETAIESQRHNQRKNDHDTRYTRPQLKTDFVLEKQASQIYTKTLFLDVQVEIVGIEKCINVKLENIDGFTKFFIKDFDQLCNSYFEVMFRPEDTTIHCSCRRFEQFGLLCRHIFYILKLYDVKEFPRKYILKRWTREAVPNILYRQSSHSGFYTDLYDRNQSVVREIFTAQEYTLSRLYDDIEALSLYKEYVEAYKTKADELQYVVPPPSKRDRASELNGTCKYNKRPVRVPVGYKSKGSGVHNKRIKSKQEEAIVKAGKKSRQCQNCKEYGHYASTCSKPPKKT
ncbi:hypothetical protein QVD17_11985 [Tagetes erecta]|uniref:SWIM-type domain-containing protein n=1 Tax=Tagetes erecta TaxID=13708 RepID=A0AAD8P2J5_TARER|nr:hypothetical protein QVD17_11985 [Tagetes erecta]